jgi:hypothetical protein
MLNRRIIAAALVLAAEGSGSNAAPAVQSLKAGELAEFCRSTDLAAANACKFYILGAFQQASLEDKKYCIPDNLPSDRMVATVRDFMARDFEFYPRDKDLEAIGMVGAIILLNYRCKPAGGVP